MCVCVCVFVFVFVYTKEVNLRFLEMRGGGGYPLAYDHLHPRKFILFSLQGLKNDRSFPIYVRSGLELAIDT